MVRRRGDNGLGRGDPREFADINTKLRIYYISFLFLSLIIWWWILTNFPEDLEAQRVSNIMIIGTIVAFLAILLDRSGELDVFINLEKKLRVNIAVMSAVLGFGIAIALSGNLLGFSIGAPFSVLGGLGFIGVLAITLNVQMEDINFVGIPLGMSRQIRTKLLGLKPVDIGRNFDWVAIILTGLMAATFHWYAHFLFGIEQFIVDAAFFGLLSAWTQMNKSLIYADLIHLPANLVLGLFSIVPVAAFTMFGAFMGL
jgi:hypothetical protein